MTEKAGQTLSHYRLIEKIGEGGMGVVWKAEDTVLGRTVAIKVLPADAARNEERRRMLYEEARLASSVGGANVVQVFEFGRDGDLDFIVMEHVEGSPLSKILHGRPLPPDKIANLATQIAQGLSKAHRKGLVHRDLKPANILVTPEGDAKILDFGLAALFLRDDEDPGSHLETRTSTGLATDRKIAGTLPYMSPEQVRGEKLDARSDIFSLGIILYEMTTGQRPFTGPSTTDVADEVKRARPRPVHELVKDVPLDLHRILEKSLAPRPSERYQTMEDLAVDLRKLGRDLESGSSTSYQDLEQLASARARRKTRVLVSTIAGGVLAVAAAVLFLPGLMAPGANAATVMVLPMEVRGQAEGAEYVGQAFAEALAVNLAQLDGLTVLPVPAAGPRVDSRREDPGTVASQDGAGRMLTGAITRTGTRVTASLSLVSTTENRILWGSQGEAVEEDLPRLASTLAREASEALGYAVPRMYDATLNLTGGPQMAASSALPRALGALRRREVDASLEATEELVRRFPEDPAAYVLRSRALMGWWLRDGTREPLDQLEAVAAAIERLDPDNPHATICRGFFGSLQPPEAVGDGTLSTLDGKMGDSVRLLTQVLDRRDLTPALRVEVLAARAWPKRNLGDTEGAIRDLEEALELDPTNASLMSDLGAILHEAGRSREAVLRARHAVALEPSNANHYHQLARTLKGARDYEGASQASAKACELSGTQASCAAYAGNLALAGHEEEAREAARQAAELKPTIVGTYNMACYFGITGDRDNALEYFRKTLDLGGGAMWVAEDPDLAILHGDPEFDALIERMKKRLGATGGVSPGPSGRR